MLQSAIVLYRNYYTKHCKSCQALFLIFHHRPKEGTVVLADLHRLYRAPQDLKCAMSAFFRFYVNLHCLTSNLKPLLLLVMILSLFIIVLYYQLFTNCYWCSAILFIFTILCAVVATANIITSQHPSPMSMLVSAYFIGRYC